MKILVVGNGGREHALVWTIAKSPRVEQIYVAPGNAGTAQIAQNVDIAATDLNRLLNFAIEKNVSLVVVGPEAPLSEGIINLFQEVGIPAFGPAKLAAEIEASKVFSKYLMHTYNIPCANSTTFSSYVQAKEFIIRQKPPIVIKANGLAAGKGVVVAENTEEALKAIADFMDRKTLGDAGNRVIIEEYLTGKEMSTFVFTDGKTVVPLVPACDYKTVYDNGKGPNTGGMGSYSPPYFYTSSLAKTVQDNIMVPTVKAMAKENRLYKGVLYGGLMIKDNLPKTLEFNARFGDPETQVVLPRLKTDIIEIMLAVIDNKLETINIEWNDEACVAVVLASGGYPGSYKTGLPITGLEKVDKNIIIFHAGTKYDSTGRIVTNGGRVLAVVATGKTVALAREKVYNNIPLIQFEGCHYRKDIALINNV